MTSATLPKSAELEPAVRPVIVSNNLKIDKSPSHVERENLSTGHTHASRIQYTMDNVEFWSPSVFLYRLPL